MESILHVQTALRQELGLHKVKAIRNKNYVPHGTKSYVYLLSRFGFQPTKPGPYYQKNIDKKPAPSYTGLPRKHYSLLAKKALDYDASAHPGEVTAEDQQNDSMYLCEVSIGTPPQKVMLDFDTGSSDLWVRTGKSLKSKLKGWLGADGGHHDFDPSKSSTFMNLPDKAWTIQYGDGSSASGEVGTDVVSIGGLVIKDQAVELATKMSEQFSQGTNDGLLGLAFPKLNTITTNGVHDPQPTPIVNMINQDDIPKEAELFTSCFCSSRDKEQDSFYTFGWIDDKLVKDSGEDIAWTNIDNSEGFWMFNSESFSINGQKVTVSGNKAIADTGTTLALVADEVCDALYKQIKGATYSEKDQGYLIPNTVTAEDLPTFSVAVGDKEFVIQKEDLLFAPVDDNNWYGGVQSRGQNPFDILGDTFLKSIYAIWDQGNNRFGCTPKIEKVQNTNMPASGDSTQSKCKTNAKYEPVCDNKTECEPACDNKTECEPACDNKTECEPAVSKCGNKTKSQPPCQTECQTDGKTCDTKTECGAVESESDQAAGTSCGLAGGKHGAAASEDGKEETCCKKDEDNFEMAGGKCAKKEEADSCAVGRC